MDRDDILPEYDFSRAQPNKFASRCSIGNFDEDARLESLLVEGLTTGGADIPLNRQFWSDLNREATDARNAPVTKQKRARKR